MNNGKIYKYKEAGRFTIIPNSILEDQNLTLKAKGLLCYLLKLPPDWILYKSKLHTQLKDGRDAVFNAFKELQDAGYIVQHKTKDRNGKFDGYDYEIFDFPKVTSINISENPKEKAVKQRKISENPKRRLTENPKKEGHRHTENPLPEKPAPENQQLQKTVFKNTDLENSSLFHKDACDQKKSKTLYQEFIAIYDRWHKETVNVPPKIDKVQGNHANMLIVYFKQIVKDRAKKDGHELSEADLEAKVLESWQLILSNWHKLESHYQNRTRLADINSNIQIIIKLIKDAARKPSNKVNGTDTGRNVSTTNAFAAIDAMFSQNGNTAD